MSTKKHRLLFNRTSSYKKFIFVREPLERLASCYHDKFVNNPQNIWRNFRKRVRVKASQTLGSQKITTKVGFKDFLLAVIINGHENEFGLQSFHMFSILHLILIFNFCSKGDHQAMDTLLPIMRTLQNEVRCCW